MNDTDSSRTTTVSADEMPASEGTAATSTAMADSPMTAMGTTDGQAAMDGQPSTDGAAATDGEATAVQPAPARRQRMRLMRLPGFVPAAPVGGLFAAWGLAALATYILVEAGVSRGVGFGLATGSGIGNVNTFSSGLWMLLVEAGAFIGGGYVAARMARNHAIAHAAVMWVVFMAATVADALVQQARTGGSSVLRQIGMPSWSDTGLVNDWRLWIALAIFAAAALIGSLIGGAFGATANRAQVIEIEPTRAGANRAEEAAPPA